MFNLFSRSKKNNGNAAFALLKTDMHSHLLPGIDDGSPDLETSLRLIRGMKELGYTKLITTPHVMWDMYKNSSEIIQTKLEELKKAMDENELVISVHAAAEYFLDEYVENLLKWGEPLLTISGKMVLTEFSMAYPPQGLKDILFEMQMQGYQPVIAHPERYIYLERSKEFYDELKDLGCLFQLNVLALINHYGRSAYELSQYLLKKGYYDLVGTDLHNFRHLEALSNPVLGNQLQRLLDSGTIRNGDL